MLRVDRTSGTLTDDVFASLPAILRPGDLLVLNDSRVLPARLFATRARGPQTQLSSPSPSGRIEVLLTSQCGAHEWKALVRPGRKVQQGETLVFADASGATVLTAQVLSAEDFGQRTLRFAPTADFLELLDRIGHLPLPPYIRRDPTAPDSVDDQARYQTVYSQPLTSASGDQLRTLPTPGSAAAPTAGLHFTPEILAALTARGVELATLTLHVGLGTFQPVRVERLADIRLHTEHYTLPVKTSVALQSALRDGRRIIATGTTTTRTLEHCAATDQLQPHSGSTSIFLSPGHRFRLISGLLTNFHLPQSTLLMLVSAFLSETPKQGKEVALQAYAHAVRARYHFFSYGDCMLIL